MKILISFLFFCVTLTAAAQSESVKQAAIRLDQALASKDTVALNQILHPDLTYGHSNGWIESKRDVINDLMNGKLDYKKIRSKDHTWKAGKDWATLRTQAEIEFVLDGKTASLNLHVLQVWIKTNKGWQLLARQSTKI